jgi:hypothetical protein
MFFNWSRCSLTLSCVLQLIMFFHLLLMWTQSSKIDPFHRASSCIACVHLFWGSIVKRGIGAVQSETWFSQGKGGSALRLSRANITCFCCLIRVSYNRVITYKLRNLLHARLRTCRSSLLPYTNKRLDCSYLTAKFFFFFPVMDDFKLVICAGASLVNRNGRETS